MSTVVNSLPPDAATSVSDLNLSRVALVEEKKAHDQIVLQRYPQRYLTDENKSQVNPSTINRADFT